MLNLVDPVLLYLRIMHVFCINRSSTLIVHQDLDRETDHKLCVFHGSTRGTSDSDVTGHGDMGSNDTANIEFLIINKHHY